jgi:hypothetical protein
MSLATGKTVVTGIGGAALGVVLGMIIGANIGGNWFTSISLGSYHGYEATALLGAVVGGVMFGIAGAWVAQRRNRQPR